MNLILGVAIKQDVTLASTFVYSNIASPVLIEKKH